MMLNPWFWGLLVSLALGEAIGVWFAADSHYSKKLSSLEGQYQQAAKDEKEKNEQIIKQNADIAKKVNDEAKQQIGSMGIVIADLSVRLSHSNSNKVSSPGNPAVSTNESVGRESGTSNQEHGCPTETDTGPDPKAISEALEIGEDSLKSELLWREWARGTH